MAQAQTESSKPAIAGMKRHVIELPHKWWQWMIVSLLSVVILFFGFLLTGMRTGRIGFCPVKGNSMQSVFPWGTWVVVLPLRSHDGDYVVARVTGVERPQEVEDIRPGIVVKKLEGNRLVSSDVGGESFRSFEVLGVVVGQIPMQKIWPDKNDLSRMSSAYRPTTETERTKHSESVAAATSQARNDFNGMGKIADQALINVNPLPGKKYLWGTTKPDRLVVRFPKKKVVGVTVQYDGARQAKIRVGEQTIDLPVGPINSPTRTFPLDVKSDQLVVEATGRPDRMGFFLRKLIVWVEKTQLAEVPTTSGPAHDPTS